jgi:ribosome-binding ATPase YchF (GTP1/OBG family)
MHPSGNVNPLRDVDTMLTELLLNDLIAVERKLERLVDERKKGGTDKVVNARQTELFEKLHKTLSDNLPLRTMEFTNEEQKELSSFGCSPANPSSLCSTLAKDSKHLKQNLTIHLLH